MDELIEKFKKILDKETLFIDNTKLDWGFYFYKETPKEVENFTHDMAINDWLIERVRRFNHSAGFLFDSLQKVVNIQKHLTSNEETIAIVELLRGEIRNLCINLEIYFDKIVAFCRYYFFFDLKKTEKKDNFIKTLKQFENIDPTIKIFYEYCKEVYNNLDYQYIYSIRCDEVHNESALGLHNFRFANKTPLEIIDLGYKISNEIILPKIYTSVMLSIKLKNALQKILEVVKTPIIANYIKCNDNLKNVIMPKERCDYIIPVLKK